MLTIYVLVFGIVVATVGLVELLFPSVMMKIWSRLVTHRLFFLYGIVLMGAGFPLTIYNAPRFDTIIFIIGLFVVFTGPFVLLYPQKIGGFFLQGMNEMSPGGRKLAIFFDASVRITAGLICIFSALTGLGVI